MDGPEGIRSAILSFDERLIYIWRLQSWGGVVWSE
ncbi:hypothetical protein BJ928_107185 [Rhizobium sp. WW_1]|jgi:hypothetical protein|nr:hypothetical protein BJ928_107185 [Rhizobium sp. WW_1]